MSLSKSTLNKIFCFDIDGVIAITSGTDYAQSQPNESIITIVNRLYDQGHTIKLFTARGYVTKIDWRELTEKQMLNWGVHYHELIFGKPNADYYVDDKAMTLEMLKQLEKSDRQILHLSPCVVAVNPFHKKISNS